MTDERPNIVFIFADEWRGQATGYAGDPNCRTPHLDRFAAESINFTNATAGCPVCCPYRASLLTGQYPLTHGVIINDVELDPNAYSIARAFNDGGYQTAYIGKWHVYGSPDGHLGRREVRVPREYQLGFEYWKGFECNHDYNDSPYFFNEDPTPRRWEGYDAFAQSQDAANYIADHAQDDQPFLLMLSWGPPHFPLHTAPEKYRDYYKNREIVLRPNVPSHLREKAEAELRGYYAHIAALDDAFATVRDAIDKSDIADNTIFVFAADHGDMRQSQGLKTKLFPWDESVRVPFLLRWPDQPQTKGSELSVPIDAPDIMPTLLGLCDLPIPESVEGRDWSPFIRGEEQPTGDEAAFLTITAEFTEILHNGMKAYRGLRSSRNTYVRNSDGPWLLYDNQIDPYQMNNLIGSPEHAALQAKMEKRLQARLDEMGDEFLTGWTYLERAGLTHYKEVNSTVQQQWSDPFA
ncbi:sulfatase-like hydrolase/transferase [Puniceicoccus vermicola]|uniref:Sulfatase n=1 Tax=Puniceicoccus vermicola TaxID=388746 RepID=A0A7X1AZU2_9BACT|nr:sulfatase-like hydrolase/transferase [Puniceicoccus vermicola]MBC2602942.1 sulfatase [Puniceicoccus vermicola]